MHLTLTIDNVGHLPDGGPTSFTARDRGFEIGREGRDWNLPDRDLFISGRHCEIRFERGAFWLHDVSRNGTYVNGSNERMAAPHPLQQGDRIRIGRYLVAVAVEDAADQRFFEAPLLTNAPMPDAMSADLRSAQRGFSLESNPFVPSGQPTPAAKPVQSPALSSGSSPLLDAIAKAAGIEPEVLQARPSEEVAADIGALLRVVTDELSALLKARTAAKVLARSAHRTVIGATDNNPLKFVPGSAEILEILLGRRRAGYLDARQSVEEAFKDLKTHEFATYAAMQSALSRLVDDLAPEAIEQKLTPSSFMSRKTRAWDAFVATWEAKEQAHENGMLDVFLTYFSEAYAKASKR